MAEDALSVPSGPPSTLSKGICSNARAWPRHARLRFQGGAQIMDLYGSLRCNAHPRRSTWPIAQVPYDVIPVAEQQTRPLLFWYLLNPAE